MLVDGAWGEWGGYDSCTRTCGGGEKVKRRICNKPAPNHGGLSCPGPNSTKSDCNTNQCPSKIFMFNKVGLIRISKLNMA